MEENDTEQLIAAMTHVRNVRVNSEKIDKMFEPLRSTINLLKKYNLNMPDEVRPYCPSLPPLPLLPLHGPHCPLHPPTALQPWP